MEVVLTKPQSEDDKARSCGKSSVKGTSQTAAQIGRYQLIRRIGMGGMGEVWLANQLEPIHRRVALKLIKPGIMSNQVLARFDAERQALALMDHPNISRILDAGVSAGGQPYFVMEFVNGKPITAYCDERRMALRDRLILFIQVCQAIQHAHQKGIVHRDLKPSNILVEQFDDRPVTKIIDFGLVKAMGIKLTDHSLSTGLGAIVGTPVYMSPEQATLEVREITERSDIYSLGVVLYELLVGTPPFEVERFMKTPIDDVFRIVREEKPQRASEKLGSSAGNPELARVRRTDVRSMEKALGKSADGILERCLAKEPAARYASVADLIDDIRKCYRADFSAGARRPRLRRAALAAGIVLAFAGCIAWAVNATTERDSEIARVRLEAQDEVQKARDQLDQTIRDRDAEIANVRRKADEDSRSSRAQYLAKSGQLRSVEIKLKSTESKLASAEAKLAAATKPPQPVPAPSLAGTTWEGTKKWSNQPNSVKIKITFMEGGTLISETSKGTAKANYTWEQKGNSLTWTYGDDVVVYQATITGDKIVGSGMNKAKHKAEVSMTKVVE